MGRPRCDVVRNYFTFDSNKNVSVCQVDGCGVEIKGYHAGNLEKHFKSCHRYESDLYKKSDYQENVRLVKAKTVGVRKKIA